MEALAGKLATFESNERIVDLPHWLRRATMSGGNANEVLGPQQVVWLLLELCTSSEKISQLHACRAVNGRLAMASWREFLGAEQLGCYVDDEAAAAGLGIGDHDEEAELQRSGTEGHSTEGLTLQQFALKLLRPQNDAVSPARGWLRRKDGLNEPFAHYWTASSHNTCISAGIQTAVFWPRSVE
eukprot:6896739-Prymnesium_polylepis.1